MEQYDKDWPDFMQGLPLDVVVDNHKELDEVARKFNKDYDELLKEKSKQDHAFSLRNKLFGTTKNWPFEQHKEALIRKAKLDSEKILGKYNLEKSKEVTDAKSKNNEQERKHDAAKDFKKNKDDLENDQTKQTKEEKFAEEKENSADITGAQRPDKGAERARMIAEIKAAQERNRQQDRER